MYNLVRSCGPVATSLKLFGGWQSVYTWRVIKPRIHAKRVNITESQGKVRREDHGTRECLKYKNARVSQKFVAETGSGLPPPLPSPCYSSILPPSLWTNYLHQGTSKTKISVSSIHHYSVIRSLFNSQDYEYFPRRLSWLIPFYSLFLNQL